jgi:TrmH family RNA methyltransferase
LKLYKKEEDFSYTIGAFPTLELLKHRFKDVERIFISPRAWQSAGVIKIKKLAAGKIEIEENESVLKKLVKTENHFAAAVFKKYDCTLDPDADHLVLVNPDDMGNLGTIIRTLLGFGVTNLALIKPAADIFDPKVIRASMGALFKINFSYFPSFESYRAEFKRNYYPFMTTGAKNLDSLEFKEPVSLIFGNEGAGLPNEFATLGQAVLIKQTNDIDSLNLSIAVGIALNSLYLQRTNR